MPVNEGSHPTRTQLLLTPLRDSIVDKPPFISGTLQLPESCFSLFYKSTKDGLAAARHINLANATPEELEQLAQACEPASFGVNQENVLDGKVGKMDSDCFSPTMDVLNTDLIKIICGYLHEGTQSTKGIKVELFKLNVYGEGSFFKSHVDTPRSNKMFGSLVIVFPTPHKGGALLLRHRGHEWILDSGQELAAGCQPSIGFVTFFSDIEHEVAPVISGHRITLTYNLYFDDGGPVFANGMVSDHLTHLRPPNEGALLEAFTALLENPEFLADGGMLAFGLRHVYLIEGDLEHVYSILKGSDVIVYRSVRALGYEPVLYLYYERDWTDPPEGVIIDRVINFEGQVAYHDDLDLDSIIGKEGGIRVTQKAGAGGGRRAREQMEWVTPVTTFNRQGALNGNVCLVVRIGKAGDRLGYTTVAELHKAWKRRERRW